VNVEPIHNLKVFHNPQIGYRQTACRGLLIDEWLATKVAAERVPHLHIWRNQRAIVLGQQDLKLSKLQETIGVYKANGWDVLVRQSGGALVVLDPGVVNVSLIMPANPGAIQVDDDFQRLASILTTAVRQPISTGEIAGSYCPGRFDLSFNGQKFCGIAQRRYAQVTIVQAFVNVCEWQPIRTIVARDFYQQASDSQEAKVSVKLESVSSLQVMFNVNAVDLFVEMLLLACEQYYKEIKLLDVPIDIHTLIQIYAQKIQQL
jgi:octanoyl-[GcvH]:protein N-octanoyltransferase